MGRTTLSIICTLLLHLSSFAQITERERPKEWDNLVMGGRFMDRFLPMPVQGPLTGDTWGADYVRPRYVENGIEDDEWSYWGGNALLGDDGKYHLFVCRWPENADKGHMAWPNSIVVHTVSDNSLGPYEVVATIGPGHNPELFQLRDGRYVIYVYEGYYLANQLNGPWKRGEFTFEARDRKIIEGLSNLTFAQREDGSYLMICRGGGVWCSKDGISPYYQLTSESVYPPVDGRFEDPVIWRTPIQYHMIVNDWLGRIAYYLRSKDGVSWKVDPGEAYMPGIATYEDGTKVDWFKYERIKVLQDQYGRATQAHFAVIDTIKWNDLSNDNHSSKHICIPLTVGKLISLEDKEVSKESQFYKLRIKAEDDFNPWLDLDTASLRFGASEEVNFGRGGRPVHFGSDQRDMIVTFDGLRSGFTESNFAGKLLGRDNDGSLVFGYTRLPWVDYDQMLLSARAPQISHKSNDSLDVHIIVENFGQTISNVATIELQMLNGNKWKSIELSQVPVLQPYTEATVSLEGIKVLCEGEMTLRSVISVDDLVIEVFESTNFCK